jgi:two-component system, OmpR family, sensor histidine kinase KdpD
MTRLSYGGLKIGREPVDMREVVGRSVRRLRRALAEHRLNLHLPRDLPEVAGDAVLLEQVMTNILDNAAKYAPAGSTIDVDAEARSGRLVLSVGDEGPGIAPAEREKIFDMFYRVRAGDGQPAGTGLGLAICKGIVEAHGGRIEVTAASDDGLGTKVTLRLPLASVAATKAGLA